MSIRYPFTWCSIRSLNISIQCWLLDDVLLKVTSIAYNGRTSKSLTSHKGEGIIYTVAVESNSGVSLYVPQHVYLCKDEQDCSASLDSGCILASRHSCSPQENEKANQPKNNCTLFQVKLRHSYVLQQFLSLQYSTPFVDIDTLRVVFNSHEAIFHWILKFMEFMLRFFFK